MLSLVVAERVVLLYAASGAGKTSLLQRGSHPAAARARRDSRSSLSRASARRSRGGTRKRTQRLTLGALIAWDGDDDDDDRAQPSLADSSRAAAHPQDATGFADPRALIFDQFEELFTLYPAHWPQRQASSCSCARRWRRIRCCAWCSRSARTTSRSLDPFAELLPGDLRTRFRLERLGPERGARRRRQAACGNASDAMRRRRRGEARRRPAEGPCRHRRRRAARGRRRVRRARAAPGRVPEPLGRAASGGREITEEHLRTFGDVDEVLGVSTTRPCSPPPRAATSASVACAAGSRSVHHAGRDARHGLSQRGATAEHAERGDRRAREPAPDPSRVPRRRALVRADARPLHRADPTSNARSRARLARRASAPRHDRRRSSGRRRGGVPVGLGIRAIGEPGVPAVAPAKVELSILPEPTPNTLLREFVPNPALLSSRQLEPSRDRLSDQSRELRRRRSHQDHGADREDGTCADCRSGRGRSRSSRT